MPPTRATAVNSKILVWARERSGLNLEEAAARLHKPPEVLAAWERAEAYPTYKQLELLAENVYRRPVALFFLPEPPDEEPIHREFRVLPASEIEKLSADTRFALRDARAFQRSLHEITEGRNPAARLITRDIRPSLHDDPVALARQVRAYLGIELEEQSSWAGAREAMTSWRDLVEGVGVFVFKRSFEQREVSGFCVSDGEFPVIVVNNSTTFSRQIFTLIHELGHLLFGVSSITSDDAAFADRLVASGRQLEIVCNRFAGEVLVPEESFPFVAFERGDLDKFVDETTGIYNVSREVILRKLLDRGVVDRSTYLARVRLWAEQAEARSEGSGGNYYATQASYLGRAFLNLAFSQYRAGNLTLPELAEHLRIRAKNVARLEEFTLQRV